MSLFGRRIAVLGGDRRMAEVVRQFLASGASVRVTGAPPEVMDGAEVAATAREALQGAEVVVLPVQGSTTEGKVFTVEGAPNPILDRAALAGVSQGALLFTGIGNPAIRSLCAEAAIPCIEYRESDEFAIWNSIPSAEGAIQMAMEASPLTLFGSRAIVLGFGRTGRSIALLLRGLFTEVVVAARKESDLARIWASGYRYLPLEDLAEGAKTVDFIFNTVPAPVVTAQVIESLPTHGVVIDVASAPGGTDFEAAARLGRTAKLAPGLPGIVAPVTAGRIIADMITRRFALQSTEGAGI
ncbi:MAG TPA: dipicolinic acid synthetase subunit A [Symbiobacteriaceae bacterium]|nr:dipicolinic acid synthetase subunit A [Symbiobacteriaceae bacterium]